MKIILKSASRLIVVFILTMIISGGILTYLSIISISNFRELTEKKVSEEQLRITDGIVVEFQSLLEEIAGGFSAPDADENEADLSWVKEAESFAFVEDPFIADSEGRFLWPWYLEEVIASIGPEPAQPYQHNYTAAQKKEFQAKEYSGASSYYARSLTHASVAVDSARSLNALGRVSMKMEHYSSSCTFYSRIISDHASVLDPNGFPYIYYAMHNLLKIRGSDSTLLIYPEIITFLKGIHQGTVPMNSSTSDILAGIRAWNDTGSKDSMQIRELDGTINEISQKLGFVGIYRGMIRTSLEKWKAGETLLRLGRFITINDPSVDPGRIVLIDPGMDHPSGFCMDMDSLWLGFMAHSHSGNPEFEYEIALIRKSETDNNKVFELAYATVLSIYFPEFEIRVGLLDENLIDSFVMKRRWTYGIALILLLGAMLMGILLILRDLSREKHLGQLRSDFVSNVTHELKTPLTSIHLFAESVLLDRVDSESGKKEYLEIILKETERLKRIINNILDFSKKEKGKIEYKSENVDVTALIRSALNDLNYWLVELDFTVHLELEDGVYVSGDPDALKQVVINLLDNAIKYSGHQKEISIRLVSENNKIRIAFSDKGIGIPENQLYAIFEKFYRVNDPLVEGIGGTGLGLTVVKEIIDAHRGEIIVESEIKKGTKFTILLDPS